MQILVRVALASALCGLAAFSQTLTPDQRLADLRYVLDILPARHPNLFVSVPESTFRAAAAELASANSGLTDAEFYTRMTGLIAMVGDGHTRLQFGSARGASLGFRQLPVQLRYFTDGVFVTASERTDLLGARVTAVNGVGIEEALSRLKPVVSYENEFFLQWQLPQFLANEGILRGTGIVRGSDPVTFSVLLATGEETQVPFRGTAGSLSGALSVASGFTPLYSRRPEQNYWTEYLPNERTLYIRYTACVEQPGRPMSAFTAETLAFVDANPVETIVFDLRQNGGGSSGLIFPLLEGLAMRQARMRQNPAFRIYGIADGGTYSSGTTNTAELLVTDAYAKLLDPNALGLNAILVGEGTGGKPAHFGEVQTFALPNSGLTVMHSTRSWEAYPWIPDRDAIYPAVQMRMRSSDYFTRHDPWLALVLSRTQRLPQAPQGNVTVVNAASFRVEQAVAPGSFAAAFGTFPASPLSVLVAGRSAEVLAATATQIVFRVPAETPTGVAEIDVRDGERVVSQGRVEIGPSAPALFVLRGADPTQPGAVLNQDGSVNTRSNPAARGSVVQIFGTGSAVQDVRTWISGTRAQVLYSGMVGPGLWQVNAVVPETAARGAVPVYLAAGEAVSNAVTIEVR